MTLTSYVTLVTLTSTLQKLEWKMTTSQLELITVLYLKPTQETTLLKVVEVAKVLTAVKAEVMLVMVEKALTTLAVVQLAEAVTATMVAKVATPVH